MPIAITKFAADIEGKPVFDTEAEAKAAEIQAVTKTAIETFIESHNFNKRRSTEYMRVIQQWEVEREALLS